MCPLLIANMASNDKTPLTDGDISIYKTEDTKNENYIGKVLVQRKYVRGTGSAASVSHIIRKLALICLGV